MLSCSVVSPLQEKNFPQVKAIFIETVVGQREILPGHIALVTQLKNNSTVRIVTDQTEVKINLAEGNFFHFRQDAGVVLTKKFT